VRARPDKMEDIGLDAVDEKQVGLDVTLPAIPEYAFELMIPVLDWEVLPSGQCADDSSEAIGVLAAPLQLLDISLELACAENLAHVR
jgi:hypothetical protein